MSLNLEQKIIFLTWFFVFIIHCAEIMANFTKVIAPIITRKHIKGKILKIRKYKKREICTNLTNSEWKGKNESD